LIFGYRFDLISISIQQILPTF